MIDRQHLSTLLAKAIAYALAQKPGPANQAATELIRSLTEAGIYKP